MVKSIRVQILHNENERESFLRGYQKGDPLVRVYDGQHRLPYREEPTASLEYIFEQNQWLSLGEDGDSQHPWYEARSLSKGDVIILHDRAWAIESIGFRELEGFEVPA